MVMEKVFGWVGYFVLWLVGLVEKICACIASGTSIYKIVYKGEKRSSGSIG